MLEIWQLRRVGGYNIEVLTPQARREGRENLARLLVGSEGTLAFSAALELQLSPLLPRRVVGICQFPTFRAAMEASQHLVALGCRRPAITDNMLIQPLTGPHRKCEAPLGHYRNRSGGLGDDGRVVADNRAGEPGGDADA